MRGPLPLSDTDFAAVRATVLAKIEKPRTAPAWYLAFAASVAVTVMSVVAARRPIVVGPGRPHVIPSVARDLGVREAHSARHTPTPMARYARHDRPKHHKPQTTQVARIELHTADPDIRIIWITN